MWHHFDKNLHIQELEDSAASPNENIFKFESDLKSADDDNAIALRKKKTVLERVLSRLRQLILESQQKGM